MTIKLVTLLLFLATISCMTPANANTTTRRIAHFKTIVANGGGDLHIRYSDQHTAEVNGDYSDLVELVVLDETLYVTIKGSERNAGTCTIFIGVPRLDAIVQTGGGNIKVEAGFSFINSFRCKIVGGGNVDVSELSVKSFHAAIEGGGRIRLKVRDELKSDISGGGLIEYSGDPKLTSNVSGGGTIRKRS